ncbi:MAG TPA: SLATT domain-containing protein [Solirubrobacterales bacterium]|nr:SLATT domain-containing protein [Solirubrobacterales bacterium]
MVNHGELSPQELSELRRLLENWLQRCRVALSAYNDATTRTVAAAHRLGVPAVMLSALVATGVFSTLEEDPAVSLRIATGVLAVAAAVLTALQTFLRHEERAEQYREAARSYGRIRRRIEQAIRFPPARAAEARQLMDSLANSLDEASKGKPNVPQRVWDRAEFKVKGRCDARGLRALRLRMRERLDFGMGRRRGLELPEGHHLYFEDAENVEVVALDKLHPLSAGRGERVAESVALRRMHEAATGRRSRRAPLLVSPLSDGEYAVIDGNSTLAVARVSGWETIPVRVQSADASAA